MRYYPGHHGRRDEPPWRPIARQRNNARRHERKTAEQSIQGAADEVRLLFAPCDHVRTTNELWQRGHLTSPLLPAVKESLLAQCGQLTTFLAGSSAATLVHLIPVPAAAAVRSDVSVGNLLPWRRGA